MLCGKPFKPNYDSRNRDPPHALDEDGYIKRMSWCDLPSDVIMTKGLYKFVQTGSIRSARMSLAISTQSKALKEEFWHQNVLLELITPFKSVFYDIACYLTGVFRSQYWLLTVSEQKRSKNSCETGLTKTGRTYVLVNKEIEAEIADDEWWAANQHMLLLERRDGEALPQKINGPESYINPKFEEMMEVEDTEMRQNAWMVSKWLRWRLVCVPLTKQWYCNIMKQCYIRRWWWLILGTDEDRRRCLWACLSSVHEARWLAGLENKMYFIVNDTWFVYYMSRPHYPWLP